MRKYFVLLLLASAVISCRQEENESLLLDAELTSLLETLSPNGQKSYFLLPESNDFQNIPQDPNNPLNVNKVALGKMFFHETCMALANVREEGNQTYSCASCHHSAAGFQAGRKQGIGEGGTGFGFAGEGRTFNSHYSDTEFDVQPIRTPSAMNGAFQKVMLWNGQFGANGPNVGTNASWTPGTPKEKNNLGFDGLETQAIAGLTVHRMEMDPDLMVQFGYKEMFDQAFSEVAEPDRYTLQNAGLAIAAYERTLLANQAPFQKWLRGNASAMTEKEKEGAIIFFGKGECAGCHTGPALNSMKFSALGMKDLGGSGTRNVPPGAPEHRGRGGFTNNPDDDYKFKVPQLYNLKDSPFYGHGGSFGTVEEVIRYKNQAVKENALVPDEKLDPLFRPLFLSESEIDQLTEFVQNALYDPNLQRYVPSSLPSGFCFPNNDEQSQADLGCN